jgi:putative ABC transport system permease protein
MRMPSANVPLTSVATIDELVSTSLERPRSLSVLVGAFAAIAAGIAAGLLAAFASTRLLTSLLFGIGAAEGATFAAAAAALFTVALCACLIPAARATRLQPAVGLRSE